mmetsp:Transcript_3236/g.4397  ORF Transcript_3236/g.4397 Transcript_3236/m.4397 type:complete len:100 (+) Transcript_3236:507-806(+)
MMGTVILFRALWKKILLLADDTLLDAAFILMGDIDAKEEEDTTISFLDVVVFMRGVSSVESFVLFLKEEDALSVAALALATNLPAFFFRAGACKEQRKV